MNVNVVVSLRIKEKNQSGLLFKGYLQVDLMLKL